MKVELRLKQLLQEHNLYSFGVEQRMARECGLHRHTIGKMIRDQMRNPSLEVLGKVCRWLVDHNVPASKLPGALFGTRAPELWKAVCGSQKVLIYLGEYRQWREKKEEVPERRMISRHDAEVESRVNHLLSSQAAMGKTSSVVETRYVPFQFSPDKQAADNGWLDQDIKRTVPIFQDLRKRGPGESVILLGSQRVNYLVEFAVADLFDCRPFEEVKKRTRIPFYLCYRGFDRDVPSCFGGKNQPIGHNGDITRGTYYIDSSNSWKAIEWQLGVQDAGIVIVIREAVRVEIMVIGFSGRATSALGTELIEHPEKFWPQDAESETQENPAGKTSGTGKGGKTGSKKRKPGTTLKIKGKEVGIYIGKVTFKDISPGATHWVDKDYRVERIEVIPLGEKVLGKYLLSKSKKR